MRNDRSQVSNPASSVASSATPIADRLQRFTLAQTCKILSIERTTLWRRFKHGQIEGQRDGGRLYFTADQIAAYQARLSTSGRPLAPCDSE